MIQRILIKCGLVLNMHLLSELVRSDPASVNLGGKFMRSYQGPRIVELYHQEHIYFLIYIITILERDFN